MSVEDKNSERAEDMMALQFVAITMVTSFATIFEQIVEQARALIDNKDTLDALQVSATIKSIGATATMSKDQCVMFIDALKDT